MSATIFYERQPGAYDGPHSTEVGGGPGTIFDDPGLIPGGGVIAPDPTSSREPGDIFRDPNLGKGGGVLAPSDPKGWPKPEVSEDSLWGSIKDKLGGVIGNAGEILGDVVETTADVATDAARAAVAYRKLQQVLNPERFQVKTDTGAQGEVGLQDFIRAFGMGAASSKGQSAGGTGKFSAGGATAQPQRTSWVMPALLVGGGMLGLVYVIKGSR